MADESMTDFVEIVMGQSPPGDKVSHDTGIPLLNGPTEFGFHHPTPIQFTVDARKIAQPGDLLFCVRGSTTGRMNWADQKYAIGRGVAAIRHRWAPKLQPFVRAVIEFELPDLLAQATGSTFPNVSASQLATIPYPSLSTVEQHTIAHILGTLDDKIELNRRMNETLEAMARGLFKDWFVDFGPTRAKAEGRDPYLAPEIWDLFPDKLDEDGKPEGWEYGRLADIADSPSRGVRPSEVSEDTPYIGLEHMPRRSVALTEWEGAGKVTSTKYVFKRGEFLFGKLRPYFHKVGIAPIDGICSTDIVVIAPRAPHWNSLTLACISTDDFVDYTNTTSTGTKMPRTSWKTMGQYELCFSTVQVAQAFEGSIGLLTTRIVSNIRECKALSQSRDLLLPKLMSGEIRAGDTDEIVLEST